VANVIKPFEQFCESSKVFAVQRVNAITEEQGVARLARFDKRQADKGISSFQVGGRVDG
jgi:hypothetical protein